MDSQIDPEFRRARGRHKVSIDGMCLTMAMTEIMQ